MSGKACMCEHAVHGTEGCWRITGQARVDYSGEVCDECATDHLGEYLIYDVNGNRTSYRTGIEALDADIPRPLPAFPAGLESRLRIAAMQNGWDEEFDGWVAELQRRTAEVQAILDERTVPVHYPDQIELACYPCAKHARLTGADFLVPKDWSRDYGPHMHYVPVCRMHRNFYSDSPISEHEFPPLPLVEGRLFPLNGEGNGN